MTTLADKIEALAKAATPGPWDFSAKFGWIFSRPDPLTTYVIADIQSSNDTNAALIVELVNNLPTILEWKQERDQAAEALRPFAEYGKWAVDENGWNLGSPRERLCDWFGPSDFHRAATTLASIEGTRHE